MLYAVGSVGRSGAADVKRPQGPESWGLVTTWIIEPLRFVWPLLRDLPWPIQLGLGAAAIGFLLLVGSLIWERLEERGEDAKLRDE